MIEAFDVTKRYGDKLAVDSLTFTVRPGIVTGFLGPNGAGKSTTMRLILGLDRPTSGGVSIDGKTHAHHDAPLRQIGALLEANSVHPGRSAYHHLLGLAVSNGIGRSRVLEVLDQVGLSDVAKKAVGAFSLGMGRRLGIAAALLGDPDNVMLDEPVNGLDPEGVLWIRTLLKDLAARGRTVLVSSHLMSEMAMTADEPIVIGRGRLLTSGSVGDVTARASGRSVRVRTPDSTRLRGLLQRQGVTITSGEAGVLEVEGVDAAEIGERAAAAGIVLHELTPQQPSLEEAFLELTRDAVDYHATAPPDQRATTLPRAS